MRLYQPNWQIIQALLRGFGCVVLLARSIFLTAIVWVMANSVYGQDNLNYTTPYNITTVAGYSILSGGIPILGANGTGSAASFVSPKHVTYEPVSGDLFILDNGAVRKMTPAGVVTTFALTNSSGQTVTPSFTTGLVADGLGNLYAGVNGSTGSGTASIVKISSQGVVSQIFDNSGSSEGIPTFGSVVGVALINGVVYFADAYQVYSYSGSAVTLVAGGGSSGPDGTGANAKFSNIVAICLNGGNLYVIDGGYRTIRRVTTLGVVTTIAGSQYNEGQIDGVGTVASFLTPLGISTSAVGDLMVADANCLREVSLGGAVSTFVGIRNTEFYGSLGNSDSSNPGGARFRDLSDLTLDSSGDLYLADTGNTAIRKVTSAGVVTTVAGMAGSYGNNDGMGTAATTTARFLTRTDISGGIVRDSTGNVFVADSGNCCIRKITPGGTVSTFAGDPGVWGTADGTGLAANFGALGGMCIDSNDNLYVADTFNDTVREITPGAVVTTVAGSPGNSGYMNGPAGQSKFNYPYSVAVDTGGNLFVSDAANNVVRKISSTGTVTTLAGTPGTSGYEDGTQGVDTVEFSYISGIAVDTNENVFVFDTDNMVIRKITSAGVVSTLTGKASPPPSANIDGPVGTATFKASGPYTYCTLAIDPSGNLYLPLDYLLRKITPAGTVSTLLGATGEGIADGTGSAARGIFCSAAVDASGKLYILDGNEVYRTAVPASGGTAAATVTLGGLTATYTGSPHAVTVTTKPTGLSTSVTYNGSPTVPTDAGSYTVVATVTASGYTGSNTGTLVISKAAATVALGNLSAAYNGSSHAATATTTPSGLSVTFTYSGSSTAPTAIGSYPVVATITDPNYTGTGKGTLVISKGVATVNLGSLAATYDGNPHAATATTIPSGLTVNFTYGGKTTPPTNAGSYAVVGTVSDPNYTGNATGTLVISKAAAGVTLGGLTATYSGKAIAATATTSPAGLPVTFTYNGSATAPVNAGTYAVVATINSPNATGTASGSLVIGRAAATVTLTASSLNVTFTGLPHPALATTIPSGLAVTFTYNGSSTAPTNVGSYPVVATIGNPNYTGSTNGTLNIAPIAPKLTTNPATAVNAMGATLNATVNPDGSDTQVSFQYGPTASYGNTTTPQDAGSGDVAVNYSAVITVASAPTPVIYHYRATSFNGVGAAYGADRTFTVSPAPTFTNNAMAYQAASGAEVSQSVNPNGVATSVYIEYGTASNTYTAQTPLQSIGSGKVPINVFVLLSGLSPDTIYYYRLVTVSAAGTFPSPTEGTFTTLGFDTTRVAQKGDAAAGTSTTFASFGPPAVNVHDGAAFAGTLNLVTGVITSANDFGIWADNNVGTRHLIAQTGTAAAGTGGDFLTLSDPVYNDNEEVAFRGTLKVLAGEVTSATATGIWSNGSGSLGLVARQGSAAAGTTGTFSTFTALGLTQSAGPVFYATIAGTGINGTNNAGIWEGETANNLLLHLGQSVGGKTLTALTFLPTELYVNGQTRSYNDQGDIACHVTFTGGTGLVTVVGGTATMPVAGGGAAAGVTSATYATLGNPSINDGDHLAFAGTMTAGLGGVTSATDAAIWANEGSNTLDLIARIGSATAPGTTAQYLTLSDPIYNNNDAVAFRATLKVATGEATSTTATGIWASDGTAGSLGLVARQGSQAPGCPTGATFSTFTELALGDQGGATNKGGVIFLGTLNTNATANVTSANNTGVWAVDTSGDLQLIVRTGDILDGKVITALSFLPGPLYVNGNSRSFTQGTGDLVYLATFSDKSTAIFNVQFP